jgi:hypothetical protein
MFASFQRNLFFVLCLTISQVSFATDYLTEKISPPSAKMASVLNKIFEATISAENKSKWPLNRARIGEFPADFRYLKKGSKFSIVTDNGKIVPAQFNESTISKSEYGEDLTAHLTLAQRPDSAHKANYDKGFLALYDLEPAESQVGTVLKNTQAPKIVSDDLAKVVPTKTEHETREFFELKGKKRTLFWVSTIAYKLKSDPGELGMHSYMALWAKSGSTFKKIGSFNIHVTPISFTDLDKNGKWELMYSFSTRNRQYGTHFRELENSGSKKLKEVSLYAH